MLWYARQEGMLDITPESLPDFYLVMTGLKTAVTSSRGKTRPWTIEFVYLFEARPLVTQLQQYEVKLGMATSVRQALWQAVEIYPVQHNSLLVLSDEQQQKWLARSRNSALTLLFSTLSSRARQPRSVLTMYMHHNILSFNVCHVYPARDPL